MKYEGKSKGGLVYSTDKGRLCPQCEQSSDRCRCRRISISGPGDGIVRLSRETKGRKGSGVTLISGLSLEPEPLKKLAKQLKKKCGSGGSVKNGVVEIQGDQRQQLIAELEKEGYKVKLSGG